MKKFLSALVVFCMIVSTSLVAFAFEAPTTAEVEGKIQGAGEYVGTSTGTYGVANAYNFERLVRSGADVSAYKDAFVQDVKNILSANSGRLVVSVYDYVTNTNIDVESITYYAAVIRALDEIGEDPTDVNGVDLTAIFLTYNATAVVDNPYLYANIIDVASAYGDDALARSYIDALIANYYTMGSGLNYWGYSCDNTAHFIEAIAQYGDDYQAYLDDAINVVKTYKLDKGYFADTTYTTSANADSTGLALQAFCLAYPNSDLITEDDLAETYALLSNFETGTNGVYDFTDNTTPNAYATADALMGLGAYLQYLYIFGGPIPEIPSEPTPKPATETETQPEAKKETKKSPATGMSGTALALTVAFAGAGAITITKRKYK